MKIKIFYILLQIFSFIIFATTILVIVFWPMVHHVPWWITTSIAVVVSFLYMWIIFTIMPTFRVSLFWTALVSGNYRRAKKYTLLTETALRKYRPISSVSSKDLHITYLSNREAVCDLLAFNAKGVGFTFQCKIVRKGILWYISSMSIQKPKLSPGVKYLTSLMKKLSQR